MLDVAGRELQIDLTRGELEKRSGVRTRVAAEASKRQMRASHGVARLCCPYALPGALVVG